MSKSFEIAALCVFAITYRRFRPMNMAILLATTSLLIWAYLLCARGGFWRVQPPGQEQVSAVRKRIVAVIPARNEAHVIARSVSSLLSQTGILLQVIVVDDSSEDGTAHAAHIAASALDASTRLQVLAGKPLPAGWSGKLWAVQQGIDAAMEFSPDYLLLTDADIEHSPDNVMRLTSLAEQNDVDLASFMVKLHCGTVPEKLLIPAFVFFFLKLYTPKWIANGKNKTAGAAGGCMLIRPAALERAGGIEAIRG